MRAEKSNLCSLFILIYDMKTDNYIFGSDLGSLVESVYLEIPYTDNQRNFNIVVNPL